MRIKSKNAAILFAGLLLIGIQPVQADDGPGSSLLNNPLAVTLLILMILLLLIIGLLGNVLLGTAQYKQTRETKEEKKSTPGAVLTILLLFISATSLGEETQQAAAINNSIGGMSATTFYIMTAVLFLELFVILALLINIKMLLKVEKEKENAIDPVVVKKTTISWWSRFNKLRPIEQEADIDLGHDYDGIRELDNRLPPWWLYGFYLTIVVAGIYLWRFHVSHSGLSSKQEYEYSIANAELKIKEYLKEKGEMVNEDNVAMLTDASDITDGKKIFITSCASCHKPNGAGDVGPNLTDDYWMHGNNIKSIFKTIAYGINAMPQWKNSYSNKQIAQVASYIKTLVGTKPANPKEPQGELVKEVDLTKKQDSTVLKKQ
ncbi:MAG: cbb3-type cytochrome c oxidase N-terminal domain-containing protein [Chitinophagaceae bacterium]